MLYPWLWAMLILFPFAATASPAEDPEEKSMTFRVLDKAQALIGNNVNLLANRLDSFFANQRADDELGRSVIRLRTTQTTRDRARGELRNEFRINLRLPKVEERFKLMWKTDEVIEDTGKTVEEKKQLAEKIAKNNLTQENWLFRADAGVNATIPPVIFGRARLRKNTSTGDFIHRFVEELAWFSNDEGLYNRISLDSDYNLAHNLLFRFVNFQEWRITRKNFTTAHGPTILHRLTDRDGISYGLIMSSIIEKGVWYVGNYGLSLNYRRDLYKSWLFLDINPGIDFPKLHSFRRTPFLLVRMEALFGAFR